MGKLRKTGLILLVMALFIAVILLSVKGVLTTSFLNFGAYFPWLLLIGVFLFLFWGAILYHRKISQSEEKKSWFDRLFTDYLNQLREIWKSIAVVLFLAFVVIFIFLSVFSYWEGHSTSLKWFLRLGLVLSSLTALGYYILVIRPGQKAVVGLNNDLAREQSDFLKCQKRYDEIESELDSELYQLSALKATLRQETLLAKGELAPERREKLEGEIIAQQKKVKELADKLDWRYKNVIRPRKKDGDGLQIEESTTDRDTGYRTPGKGEKVKGLNSIKRDIRDEEQKLVTKGFIPVTLSLIFLVLFSILLLVSAKDSYEWVGDWTKTFFYALFAFLTFYLSFSFKLVNQTERGLKFFLGRPYHEVGRGWCFAPWGLVLVTKFDITVQYYVVPPDKVYLTGRESQELGTRISVPYQVGSVWDLIVGVGMEMEVVTEKMEGRKDVDEDPGMIGDKVKETTRALVAQLGSLDAALQMRRPLAAQLVENLNEDYGYLGVNFGKVNITDVDPEKEMMEDRLEKARAEVRRDQTAIEIDTAKNLAAAKIEKAQGDAVEKEKLGRAEAAVSQAKGEAQAKVILAGLKAKVDAIASFEEKKLAQDMLPVISTLLLAEDPIAQFSKLAEGMKVNLIAVPGIDQVFSWLKRFVPNQPVHS